MLLDVPELLFLQVDGHGDPNTAPVYGESVQALYGIAYALRFALRQGPEGVDAPVMPLEGLWWSEDMATFTAGDTSAWDWTLMIRVPDLVDAELLEAARAATARKRPTPALDRVRLRRWTEGLAAQVLHVGPYSAEGPTIAALHQFIADQGLVLTGVHHEVYLGDPRRAAPERLRTIIRQPAVRP